MTASNNQFVQWPKGSATNYGVNTEPKPPLARAQECEQAARKGARRMHDLLRSVSNLMGHPFTESLARPLEDLTENMGEAFHHYGLALAETKAEHHGAIEFERQYRLALANMLREAIADTRKRFQRAHKPVPQWVEDAALLVYEPDSEPF